MQIFMLPCDQCGSTKQDPKLTTTICPDCKAERQFVKVIPPEDNNQELHADVVTPDLEKLRDKYLGKNHGKAPVQIADKQDIMITVQRPGSRFSKTVIIDSETGVIIGEQG